MVCTDDTQLSSYGGLDYENDQIRQSDCRSNNTAQN